LGAGEKVKTSKVLKTFEVFSLLIFSQILSNIPSGKSE